MTGSWCNSLISANIPQLLFRGTKQEIATFWSLHPVVSTVCCISPNRRNKSGRAQTAPYKPALQRQGCAQRRPSKCWTQQRFGAGPFLALQITLMNWSLISMQQAWENDKLLLTLSWQLKKWLLWKNTVHNRRKAKASFLSSVWHLLFNIQNCIIVTHTSAGIAEGLSVIVIIISSYFQGLRGSSLKFCPRLQPAIQDFSLEAKFIVQF